MVNGKAFVIAKESLPGMNSAQLYSGLYLNWYDGLTVVFSKDKQYVLIGECWSIKKDDSPQEFLTESTDFNTEKILMRENFWCGRYILILKDTIYMDAVGSMSVYYNDDYVSDSLNLLREMMNLDLKKEKIYEGLSPDFVPGTHTQYDGIKRLLPSLVYNFESKTVSSRALLPEYPVEFQSKEERIRAFVSEFSQCLRNIDKHFEGKTKLITCTGGRDSRTVLAASQYAGLRYDTFLLEHDEISDEDITISKQLSDLLGRKHYYIKQNKSRMSAGRLADFDRHTCNYENGVDKLFYGYGQFEDLRDRVGNDIVILRGAIWETTSEFYGEFMKEDLAGSIWSIFPLLPYQPRYRESGEEWMKTVTDDTENRQIEMSARIYWDLRAGCWLSVIEQAFDIYDGIISVQPINCRRLLSLLLGFDKEDRVTRQHEMDITDYACPQFKDIPYDFQTEKTGGESSLKRYKEYFKKASCLLRHFGPGAVMMFVKNKNS